MQEGLEVKKDGLTRKERIRQERQQEREAIVQSKVDAARNINKGESPFSVSAFGKITGRDITFSGCVTVNGKVLFKDMSAKFSAGCRYGLMGPNGRGKSTLLRLMETRELPVQANLDVLLVEQEQEYHECGLTAVQAVLQSHKKKQIYEEEVTRLRAKEELDADDLEHLNFIEDELNYMGAAEAEAKVRRILFGLGFPTEWHDRPTNSFSGGWRKRVALACAVFIEPDMLLLDEPTNHLDLNAVLWLENYICQKYSTELNEKHRKILIVVSHDAGFLDRVCSHIIHIENYKLNYYRGSYSSFQKQLVQAHEEFDKKHNEFRKKIENKKKEMSKAQVEEWVKNEIRTKTIDEALLTDRKEYVVNFPFKEPHILRDSCLVKLEDVAFGYPHGPELFSYVNISLWSDSRITLCGPNGIGKTTLLNLMTGTLECTKGTININRQLRIGRYNQHFVDKLPLEKSAVEVLLNLKTPEPIKTEYEARKLLGSFGLEGIVHLNQIATLSGGQKARVAFAVISAECPHFLLLDEPTNHLDVEAIEALLDAIKNFKGGVLCVTHDSRLITETNMVIWVAGNHTVRKFDGNLDDYRDYVAKMVEQEEVVKQNLKATAIQVKEEKKLTLEEKREIEVKAAKRNNNAMMLLGEKMKRKKLINEKREMKKAAALAATQ